MFLCVCCVVEARDSDNNKRVNRGDFRPVAEREIVIFTQTNATVKGESVM